jgi:hypothetical protein
MHSTESDDFGGGQGNTIPTVWTSGNQNPVKKAHYSLVLHWGWEIMKRNDLPY